MREVIGRVERMQRSLNDVKGDKKQKSQVKPETIAEKVNMEQRKITCPFIFISIHYVLVYKLSHALKCETLF